MQDNQFNLGRINMARPIDKNQETAEDRLTTLIKQAGDEARARKREALAQHFKKLQAVIDEAVSRQHDSMPT